ncbi:MAG: 4Fe-4S cluster-binding domain-containing protein [Sutterella sp.]|nr:4Fe-4S cluster-binding domain-containing protein [Sutterella sp.]
MTSSAGQRISCNVVETRRNDVARIFNIQRYSLNDGEGIRTVVFFKGCPHLCPWCANPESISGKIQTVRREAKCLHCAKCVRDADECPSGAFERIGRDISLDALEREVMKDDIFFRTSGGGVTLSGGEASITAADYGIETESSNVTVRIGGLQRPRFLPETSPFIPRPAVKWIFLVPVRPVRAGVLLLKAREQILRTR